MNFIKRQEEFLLNVINVLGYDTKEVVLNVSSRKEFGDYQYNGVMALAKMYHKNPIEIANQIAEKLKDNTDMMNINIQGPGFINVSFTEEALVNYMNELLTDLDINIAKEPSKKILIDYGGANVSKTLHIGHLRSANIGEAIKRLAQTLGYQVIGDAHLGDYGRPIGLVILELKKRYPNLVYFKDNYNGENEEIPVDGEELNSLYPYASGMAKENEEYLEEARSITLEMQKEGTGYNALWKKIIEVSKNDIKQVYDKLNAHFDLWEGESDAVVYIPEVVNLLRNKGIVYESEGALVIDVKKDTDEIEVPPFILVKSNGGVMYTTTEIATIYSRQKRFDLDEVWYFTDERQSLHFKQTFRVAEKADVLGKTKLYHYGFGTMNGPDGKPFKTRDGGVLPLKGLLALVKDATYKKIKENVLEEEKDAIAEITSIAAIKYADLLPYRTTDYIFDVDKFSDVEGKTGPYLLYSTVRMKSLLNKANEFERDRIYEITGAEDRNIMLIILDMPKVLTNSLNNKSLNELAEYLYKLTSSFNTFYQECHVLTESDLKKRTSWLALIKLVLIINEKLLNILAIDIPDKI